MTREEAIKKLKWFREYNEYDFCGGDRIQDECGDWYYRITEQDFEAFDMAIKALEQEPKTVHCKDCKWWKDSDGVFRRGFRAESQCPMNRIEVFEGNGYCYMFEPQESEAEDDK